MEAVAQDQPNNEDLDQVPAQDEKAQLDEFQFEDLNLSHHLNANVLQMAVINKMLPKGYKFELLETVQRLMEANRKRNAGLANYQIKRPEIQNEKKQQRIMQKYNQKRIREQQKLEQQQTMLMNDKNELLRQEGLSSHHNNQPEGKAQPQMHSAQSKEPNGRSFRKNSYQFI